MKIILYFQIILINGIPAEKPSLAALVQSHLDDFFLLDIFDELSFSDLLNLAPIDPRFVQLIAEHQMIHKYHIDANVIRIDGGGMYDRAKAEIITIGKYTQILTFLRHFGHLVTKVYFSGFSYNSSEREQITRFLIKYCGNTLVEVELIESGGLLINGTTGSLPRVTKLKVRDDNYLYDNQQIHRIYPALKELTLSAIAFESDDHSLNYFRELLRQLPELRGFGLTKVPSIEYVRLIEQHLPKLESLEIGYVPNMDQLNYSHGQRILFKNVQHLSLNIRFYNLATRISQFPFTFEQLETLEISTTKIEYVPWNLFDENRQVKALAFPTITHLERLLDFLHELEETHRIGELTVLWTQFMGSDYVVRLMTEFNRLQKIKFIVWDGLERAMHRDALLALIPSTWYAMVTQKESPDARMLHHVVVQRYSTME